MVYSSAHVRAVLSHGRYGRFHRFLGFIDIDEFIVTLDPQLSNINDLLRPYEPYAGVILYWRLLGSSGHKVCGGCCGLELVVGQVVGYVNILATGQVCACVPVWDPTVQP